MSYNKNIKLYVQNTNKSSKKEFYHQSLQVYSNKIYEIYRKINEEGIPLENLTDQIEFLKKKYNIFKNKDKSLNYLSLLNLTNTLIYKSDAITYETLANQLNEDLIIANINLNDKTEQLQNCLQNTTNFRTFKIPEMYLVKNININKEYLIYIKEYGIPQDGIFKESLLEFIRITQM
jgi:hypothetical protein